LNKSRGRERGIENTRIVPKEWERDLVGNSTGSSYTLKMGINLEERPKGRKRNNS